jgi:MOSC domain-containing protein YiiM
MGTVRSGEVEAIFLHGESGGPMRPVDSARAVAGRGLVEDRYWQGGEAGAKPDREVTLIEAEAVEAVPRDERVALEPSETRRNIVTRRVALNHLVGREFRVGGATLRGIRLCEPCGHLESLTRPGVKDGLTHRGGLRAAVLEEGEIRVGDPVDA